MMIGVTSLSRDARMIVVVLALALLASPSAARTVTDGTGRQVEIPNVVERIIPAGQPAAVLLYTLAPETMVGWPRVPGPPAQPFLKPPYGKLPDARAFLRDGRVDVEMIRAARPDMILDYGFLTPQYVELAKRVQAETGVPYVLLDGRLDRAAEVYRLLGPVVGAAARAETLAVAAERYLSINRERAAQRRAAGPITVYYTRTGDGLTTATYGSNAADVLRLLGLENVVAENGSPELIQVSREQVFAWNPDVIFTPVRELRDTLKEPAWAALPAVQKKRVYVAPRPPFGWIDEPPSVNRLLGLIWAGHVLYPDAYPEDLRQEVRDFYRLFYQVEPSDQQLDQLLR